MTAKTIFTRAKPIAISFLIGGCAFLLVSDSKGISQSVSTSISACLTTLIPSLLCFMFLSTYLLESGLHQVVFAPLWQSFGKIYKMNREQFSIFMLSLIGGYPVGVKLLRDYTAYNNNYTEIATRMLSYCYNSGPAFVVGIVGICVYDSVQIGLIIFLSNTIACLICALFVNFKQEKPVKQLLKQFDYSINTIFSSLRSTGKALFTVCLTVVLFNAFIEILSCCGIIDSLSNLLTGFLGNNAQAAVKGIFEITNVKSLSAVCPVPVAAMLISLGGLCVIMQVSAISNGALKMKLFLLMRLPMALLSGLICFGLCDAFDVDTIVSASVNYPVVLTSTNLYADLCLGIMMVLLLSINRRFKN